VDYGYLAPESDSLVFYILSHLQCSPFSLFLFLLCFSVVFVGDHISRAEVQHVLWALDAIPGAHPGVAQRAAGVG